MTATSHLYLLVFPEHNIIKIGKADDIHERIQTLRRWWGEADYAESYQLSASRDVVFRLEKSLLFLLADYAVQFDQGDGRTELFSAQALSLALKHVELFSSSRAVPLELLKGIKKPTPKLVLRPRSSKLVKHRRSSHEMAESVSTIAKQFDRINRLLLVLLRRKDRLAYQFEIIDRLVYFRLRSAARHSSTSHKVIQMFSFSVRDLNGFCGISCCSMTRVGDIIQYEVRLPFAKGNDPWWGLFSYFLHQSQCILDSLPKRSPATVGEIPILDLSEVRADP